MGDVPIQVEVDVGERRQIPAWHVGDVECGKVEGEECPELGHVPVEVHDVEVNVGPVKTIQEVEVEVEVWQTWERVEPWDLPEDCIQKIFRPSEEISESTVDSIDEVLDREADLGCTTNTVVCA